MFTYETDVVDSVETVEPEIKVAGTSHPWTPGVDDEVKWQEEIVLGYKEEVSVGEDGEVRVDPDVVTVTKKVHE